jgi:hypothetical protein
MRRLFALSCVVFLAGCSAGDTKIDQKEAEKLARKIADSGRVRVQTVSCPSGVKAKKGESFDCALVYADGTKGTITIQQLDDEGRIRTAGSDIHIVEK